VNSVRHFELDVADDHAVLMRITSVCHQRNCQIVALRYERGAGRVSLSVDGGSEHAARLEQWLAKLVHVIAVRTRSAVPVRPTVPALVAPPRRSP
jgi:hypothetical protein